MAVDGYHRLVPSIAITSMQCKKGLAIVQRKKKTESAVVCYKYVFSSKSISAICAIGHL